MNCREAQMILALSSIAVARSLGYGAGQKLIIRGVRGGETQAFFMA